MKADTTQTGTQNDAILAHTALESILKSFTQRRTQHIYFCTAAFVLACAGLSKIPDLLDSQATPNQLDMVTGLKARHVMLLSLSVDLLCVLALLSKLADVYKHITLIWIGLLFVCYHLVLHFSGLKVGCPCIGSAVQKIVMPGVLSSFAFGFSAAITAVSCFCFCQSNRLIRLGGCRSAVLVLTGLLMVETLPAQTETAMLISGHGTNTTYLRNSSAETQHSAEFIANISSNGWIIKVKASNHSDDYAEVGGQDGRIYTLLKTIDQSQKTNNPVFGSKNVRGKASTCIVDSGTFPHTYWCDWATPIWYALASGLTTNVLSRDGSDYMEPLLLIEGNGDLLHDTGFTQRVYSARQAKYPKAPVSTSWMHDGIMRNWEKREDSWAFPPQQLKLGFPFSKGYTNAHFQANRFTNVVGWLIPTQFEYLLYTRGSLTGFRTNHPVPLRLVQHYSFVVTNARSALPLGDYRPDVRGDFSLVKDNRFFATHKVTGVNYFQRNEWKPDKEVLDSMAFFNRKKEMGLVASAALQFGPTLPSKQPKSLQKPIIMGLITITTFAILLVWVAKKRTVKSNKISHN